MLEANLADENTMRVKQYHYYRDTLLTFKDDVPRVRLGDVGEFIRGNGLTKKYLTNNGVPAIHYGQIYTYYGLETDKTKSFTSPEIAQKLKRVNKGDIIITNTSENLEDVGKALLYIGNAQAVTGGHATILKPSSKILAKYLVFFTQTEDFYQQKRKLAKGTKVIDVSATDMKEIKIPLPSLQEQEKIVKILDQFDALSHSITTDLPKAIELHEKRYQYYRDALLDFKVA